MDDKIFIIAEIGCNHNGDFQLAKTLIEKAKEAGVDAVKFQTFNASKLISKFAPKAEYQKITTGSETSQLEMTKKLELPIEEYIKLKKYAESLGLIVFSTAFDMDSVLSLEKQNQVIWKIPSGELTNLPYLQYIADIKIDGKKIILSTGMATIAEIHETVKILKPEENDITILHCNTEYPTQDTDVNVSAMIELAKEFPAYKIGYSDHSVGSTAAVMSVAFGGKLVEKHFTLDKTLPGPDHKASATPDELKELVDNIRRSEVMYGTERKIVTDSERKNIIVARKSILAAEDIKKGEIFTEENLTCKRPGNGISPMNWFNILGEVANKDFEKDQLIEAEGFDWEEQ